MDLTEKMQEMERKRLAQIKEVQNRVIIVERTQPPPPPRTFPARQTWQRKNPNHEQRPPHQLEAANMVEPYKPFCRACRDFHDESSCYYACYVQEHGFPQGCGPKASSSEHEYINYVDDYDHEEGYSQGCNTSKEESLTSEMDDNSETLIKNPILEVSCDEIPPCTPPDDKYLECWVPCDIFETQIFEEDCFEQNEKCRQGLDTSDEASHI